MIASAIWTAGRGGFVPVQYLQWIFSLPRAVLIAIAMIAALAIFCFWLLARAGRRRIVTLQHSDATEMIAFQLARIADAVERLSLQQGPPPASTQRTENAVRMSMFGR
jgi:hypothetical protein